MAHYYDRQGNPLTLDQWIRVYEKREDRRLLLSEIPPDFRVSTVYLGLDHGPGEDGRPLIFETMVFQGNDWADLDCSRYSTESEAREGHAEMVARWTGTAHRWAAHKGQRGGFEFL